jgi:hypothetical protein
VEGVRRDVHRDVHAHAHGNEDEDEDRNEQSRAPRCDLSTDVVVDVDRDVGGGLD